VENILTINMKNMLLAYTLDIWWHIIGAEHIENISSLSELGNCVSCARI
jgi:hypothetical protein